MRSLSQSREVVDAWLTTYEMLPKSTYVILESRNVDDDTTMRFACTANELVGSFWQNLKTDLHTSNGQERLVSQLRHLTRTSTRCRDDKALSNTLMKQRIAINHLLFEHPLHPVYIVPTECAGHGTCTKKVWNTTTLSFCSQCRAVMYCSKACQREGWRGGGDHKHRCVHLKEAFKDVERGPSKTKSSEDGSIDGYLAENGYSSLDHFMMMNPSSHNIFKM